MKSKHKKNRDMFLITLILGGVTLWFVFSSNIYAQNILELPLPGGGLPTEAIIGTSTHNNPNNGSTTQATSSPTPSTGGTISPIPPIPIPKPLPTPTPKPPPKPTPKPIPPPKPSPTPKPTPTPSPSVSPSATPSPIPSETPQPSDTPTPTPSIATSSTSSTSYIVGGSSLDAANIYKSSLPQALTSLGLAGLSIILVVSGIIVLRTHKEYLPM